MGSMLRLMPVRRIKSFHVCGNPHLTAACGVVGLSSSERELQRGNLIEYIVRIIRNKWYRTDYVGTFKAGSAVEALVKAGRCNYFRQVCGGRVVAVTAEIAATRN